MEKKLIKDSIKEVMEKVSRCASLVLLCDELGCSGINEETLVSDLNSIIDKYINLKSN